MGSQASPQSGLWTDNAEPATTAGGDASLDQAVQEVDRSLLRWSLGLSPRERLRAATRAGMILTKLRRARA